MDPIARLDHLVYAAPDLDLGIEAIERLTGVRAIAAGRHPGAGTRNALVALGPASYLEIIAPDPEQPAPAAPRLFGVDDVAAPRLATWAARATGDLETSAKDARRRGVPLGAVAHGRRKRADGVLLEWRFTDPRAVVADGIVPFLIDWGGSPHPAATAPGGLPLVELRAEHPEAEGVAAMLRALDIELAVTPAAAPALVAVVRGRRGLLELR